VKECAFKLKLRQKIEASNAVFEADNVGLAGNSGKRASAEPYTRTNGFGRGLSAAFLQFNPYLT
jgi:hypothetical protein